MNPRPNPIPPHAAKAGRAKALKSRMRDYSAVLALACPTCKAQPGDRCVRAAGRAREAHAARVRQLWRNRRGS